MISIQIRPDLLLIPLQTRATQGLGASCLDAQMWASPVERPPGKCRSIFHFFFPQIWASLKSNFPLIINRQTLIKQDWGFFFKKTTQLWSASVFIKFIFKYFLKISSQRSNHKNPLGLFSYSGEDTELPSWCSSCLGKPHHQTLICKSCMPGLLFLNATQRQQLGKWCYSHGWRGLSSQGALFLSAAALSSYIPHLTIASFSNRSGQQNPSLTFRLPKYQWWSANRLWPSLQPPLR